MTGLEVDAQRIHEAFERELARYHAAGELAERARLEGLRHRRKHRAVTGGSVLMIVVLGVAVAVSVLGGRAVVGGQRQMISARTMAYRAAAALGQANRTRIEYTHTVSLGSVIDEWSYGDSIRDEILNAGGTPIADGSATISGGIRTVVTVDYANRSWSLASGRSAALFAVPDEANLVRQELANGQLKVIGHAALKRQQSIELAGIFPSKQNGGATPLPPPGTNPNLLPPVALGHRAAGVLPLTYRLWINPSTYLPIRVAVTGANGTTQSVSTIRWLTPDAANLAQLHAPIPAGFTRMPPLGE